LHLRDPRCDDVRRIRKDCDRVEKTLGVAKKYSADGKPAHALALMHKLVECCPAAFEHDVFRLQCMVGAGKYDQAYALSTRLLREANGQRDTEVLYLRAICLYHRNDFSKATVVLKSVLRHDPDNRKCVAAVKRMRAMETTKRDGNTAYQARQWQTAVDAYTDCLDIDPKCGLFNSRLLCNRAAAHINLTQYASAVDDCSRALEIDPSYAKAYVRRASAYLSQGKQQRNMGVELIESAIRDNEKVCSHLLRAVNFARSVRCVQLTMLFLVVPVVLPGLAVGRTVM